jgi:hypothetical protein
MHLHTLPDSDRAGAAPAETAALRAITVASLLPLPAPGAGRQRPHLQQAIAYRRARSFSLGPCMRLQFEDEHTLRHQIREVLRAERITDEARMQREIDTYAHLLPDGTQWKATLLIELPDARERERELPQLNLAAHRLYVSVPHQPRVFARANEDLEDFHRGRPSAVHFLRFPLTPALRAALLAGEPATLGCAHDHYDFHRLIPARGLQLLCSDLSSPR